MKYTLSSLSLSLDKVYLVMTHSNLTELNECGMSPDGTPLLSLVLESILVLLMQPKVVFHTDIIVVAWSSSNDNKTSLVVSLCF